MESPSTTTTTTTTTTYWCHMCQRTVAISRSDGNDLVCPLCNGGFVEETGPSPAEAERSSVVFGGEQARDQDPRWAGDAAAAVASAEGDDGFAVLRFVRGSQAPNFVHILQAMSEAFQQGRQEDGGGQVHQAAGFIDPIALVQNVLGGRAGNVEVFLDNGTGTARRLTGNIGDYYFGQGLDQLIQQLAENDTNRYGTPPASKSAIEALPTVSITNEHMGTDAAHCAVCMDEFKVGTQVRQMPCKHLYHEDCILPWLTQHNSCPVCRYELPTDDPDYDSNKSSSNNENTSSSGSNSSSPGSLETGAVRGRTARGLSIETSEAEAPSTSAGTAVPSSAATAAPASPPASATAPSRPAAAPSSTAAAAAATATASPSMGRRGSFHFPWPFGRSSSSPQPPASPQQGQQQSADARRRSGNDSQAPSSSSDNPMRQDVLD